jgi:GNAT superfamily N-acetyltransferase
MIRYLADVPEAVTVLAEAFSNDGFAHPDDQTLEAVATRLREGAQRAALPVALVAVDDSGVQGTAALRWDSIGSRPALGPWLAALYVMPGCRRRGVGGQLVRAIEDLGRGLGFGTLYAGTHTAESLLRRLAWMEVERLDYAGGPLSIFQRDLVLPPPGMGSPLDPVSTRDGE